MIVRKPKLLIAESKDFSPSALELLESTFDVELADLDRACLMARLSDVNFLWVRLRNHIDREVLSCGNQLQAVATNTTGLNHIDLDVCAERGINVISLRGETKFLETIHATAEHTIALALALLRNLPAAVEHVNLGGWNRDLFRGHEIHNKTVGVIGYGRLGRIVARIFSAFEARVIVNSTDLICGSSIDGFAVVALEELLSTSDIVTLHASYSQRNHLMIGASQFSMMNSSAVFINTARGELVDESALGAAIEKGVIAGAAIDVLANEQTGAAFNSGLLEIARLSNRLLITPHIAGNTYESRSNTENFLAQKLCECAANLHHTRLS